MGTLHPMSTFDPSQPAVLHERRSDRIVTWTGDYADNFRLNRLLNDDGSMEWDGQVYDGWGNVLGG